MGIEPRGPRHWLKSNKQDDETNVKSSVCKRAVIHGISIPRSRLHQPLISCLRYGCKVSGIDFCAQTDTLMKLTQCLEKRRRMISLIYLGGGICPKHLKFES
jgi:hypothetical protein